MLSLANGYIHLYYNKVSDTVTVLELDRETVAPKRTTYPAIDFISALYSDVERIEDDVPVPAGARQ